VRDANRSGALQDEEDVPAPDTDGESADELSYWFVGSIWQEGDQTARFRSEGIWENGYTEDQLANLVRSMKPGDRIAIKASFVQKRRLQFDVGGKPVSVMRIKATGTILKNLDDGRRVKVAWDPPFAPRDWYFYTYRTTIVEADLENETARRLVDFTFRGEPQDYRWFLEHPYWAEKYGVKPLMAVPTAPGVQVAAAEEEDLEVEEGPTYTIDTIRGGILSLC
jgi:5-methylcytosine-specific restriction protein B